jgi:undecaprenyl diphosphate synthase
MPKTAIKPSSSKPRHIAIIMDGNNRWARQRGVSVSAGHRAGVENLRDILDACKKHGVEVLTVFAFSSENWLRPAKEVNTLMNLFMRYLDKEAGRLRENSVRLRIVGERSRFSKKLQEKMAKVEAMTAPDATTTLVIAADYGGRWDIARAARKLAEAVQKGEIGADDITPDALQERTSLADLPEPDLCIRTGGDHRISNFLLWQFAYTELYFTETYWPDFGEADLDAAITDYGSRQRRFGGRPEEKAEHA